DVREALEAHSMVILTGPSSAGKSSLLRAGIEPMVSRVGIAKHGQTGTFLLRPGGKPIESLARALAEAAPMPLADVLDSFASGSIKQMLEKTMRSNGSAICLLVDQLEEVFRTEQDEQARFLNKLADIATIKGCAVIVSIRSDFYARLMEWQ